MDFLEKLAKKWQDAETPPLSEWAGVQLFLGWVSENVVEKRFNHSSTFSSCEGMEEDPNGEYVKFEDCSGNISSDADPGL